MVAKTNSPPIVRHAIRTLSGGTNAGCLYRAKATANRVRDVLVYNPATGFFGWRKRRSGQPPPSDKPAGYVGADGYWKIRLDGVTYQAHRLIWLYVQGRWPLNDIDHINLDKADNHWNNLRETTHHGNMRNVRSRKGATSSSKLKGAYLETGRSGQWFSAITVNGKSIRLGAYKTAEAAHQAYCRAAVEIFGEFARTE